jgi:hypothetical protein
VKRDLLIGRSRRRGMMVTNERKWISKLALIFVAASVIVYALQIAIFHKDEETFFLLFQDMAFLPVHTLLVVIILETLLKRYERRAMMRKLNMVVGVFFIEVGYDLMKRLAEVHVSGPDINKTLRIDNDWTDGDFVKARKRIGETDFKMDSCAADLGDLQEFFRQRRSSMIRMMENPNLLEHESFTDMLLAALHLGEELIARSRLRTATEKDCLHLAGDMSRAYNALIVEWLSYMRHLKREYPYLYSLAVRTNPFNPEARPEIS